MEGKRDDVALRLTELVRLEDVKVSADDFWMPQGLPRRCPSGDEWCIAACKEAQLGKTSGFLSPDHRRDILYWWLSVQKGNVPNWDIATTALIDGGKGLVLIEAKAHTGELKKEEAGKKLKKDASQDSHRNHEQIGNAIRKANENLRLATGLNNWGLSWDSHYQISNRFAWSWKIASLGVPVVLVYLGFLRAEEMPKPFTDEASWEKDLLTHSDRIVPKEIWGKPILVNGTTMVPLLRHWEQPLY
jgi:hypothetical protein